MPAPCRAGSVRKLGGGFGRVAQEMVGLLSNSWQCTPGGLESFILSYQTLQETSTRSAFRVRYSQHCSQHAGWIAVNRLSGCVAAGRQKRGPGRGVFNSGTWKLQLQSHCHWLVV